MSVTLPNGARLSLWSRADDWISTQLFWRGWTGFEADTTPVFFRFATRARVTLDVGAYVGFYSLLAAKANPNGVAHAFEPHPQIFARLQQNVARNRAAVTCVQKAVGATTGTARFFHVPSGLPSSSSLSESFMRSGGEEILATDVSVITLDEYVRGQGIGAVDLVKIDTETTEPAVLAGMEMVLERDRPAIFCEVLAGRGVERAIAVVLARFGYRSYRLTSRGPIGGDSVEELQQRLGQSDANYLFAARPTDLAMLR